MPALDGLTVTCNAQQIVETLSACYRSTFCSSSSTGARLSSGYLGWVTGVMALVDLDDRETEAPLSWYNFRLLV